MRTLLALTFLVGCGGDPTTSTKDVDGDADTDADADSDADTDIETGDSGTTTTTTTTTTTDTGTPACSTPADLLPFIEMVDATGVCAQCSGELSATAGFTNPCAVDIQIEVDAACFVTSWNFQHQQGFGLGLASPCAGNRVMRTVPAGGSYDQNERIGRFESGNWQASASFSTRPVVMAQSNFQVQ